MPKTSSPLQKALGVRVPADLLAFWAERDPSAIAPGGKLAEPLSPKEIADVELAELPIDFLPLAGDGSGSFLCARLGPQGDVIEIVFWEHDNWSDGLPFGRTFTEALLISAAAVEEDDPDACKRAVRWAIAHAEPALVESLESGKPALGKAPLAQVLLARKIGLESLGQPGDEARGSRFEIHDPRFQKYYKVAKVLAGKPLWYDLTDLPAPVRAALDRDYKGVTEPAWDAIARAAERVIAERADIGWAWTLHADVAGHRGDRDEARHAVTRAATCLERTFGLHGRDALRGVREFADKGDPLVAAFLDGKAKPVAAHWAKVAARAEASKDPAAAWDAWYRHVHHAKQASPSDTDVLDAYARVAKQGRFACWAKLVDTRLRASGAQS